MALTCFASLAFAQQTATPLKVSGENKNFEWFFLLTDAGKVQGIWSKNGLNPEFVPAAGSAAQLKEQVSTGVKIGWVNNQGGSVAAVGLSSTSAASSCLLYDDT